ncbi:hypothetical protein N7493_009210 [Penicillium malachiteum]|uniref:DUF1746 domain-containing protein n=1 Tax=Penicillium malachiteum TaxID=1324776 RepID=A0AAD6MTD6_9EURO|nr:hypothetical protein N7493_009210 [Penicillium malachiteum]
MTDVDAFRDAEFIADTSGISFNDDAESDSGIGASPRSAQDRIRVRKLQSKAKIASLDRLLRDLDILVYCQLSALYYMDCSIILFAVRAIVELIFFSPKVSPFEPTRNQPFIGAILASNFICMIFHAFLIRPEAGEATRGYLHGGLFIDFIGQTPVPIFRLLSFDILILLLDFVMLGLIIERVKTAAIISPPSSTPTAATNNDTANASDGNTEGQAQAQEQEQDHDSEERGVVRGSEQTQDTSTTPPLSIEDDDINDERNALLADPGEYTSGRDNHPLDLFASGQAVIMHMGLFSTIRDQWTHSSIPHRPAGYSPSPETAMFLRQRFGLQVGTDGRIVRVGVGQ